MTEADLLEEVKGLADAYEKASDSQRVSMRPGITRVIATLRAKDKSVPRPLARIADDLDDDDDDFFDNMPV